MKSRSFSIRTALIFITLIAVLAWYRQRPWQETLMVRVPTPRLAFVNSSNVNATISATQTQTLRRLDFLTPVPDGAAILTDSAGRVLQKQMWRNGKRVSCEYFFYDKGRLVSRGMTVRGRPHGKWQAWVTDRGNTSPRHWSLENGTLIDATLSGRDSAVATFNWGRKYEFDVSLDKLHHSPDKLDRILTDQKPRDLSVPLHEFEFDNGKLTIVDGKPATEFTRWLDDELVSSRKGLVTEIAKFRLNGTEKITGQDLTGALSPRIEAYQRYEYITDQPPLPTLASLYLLLSQRGLAIGTRYGGIRHAPMDGEDYWIEDPAMDGLVGQVFDQPYDYTYSQWYRQTPRRIRIHGRPTPTPTLSYHLTNMAKQLRRDPEYKFFDFVLSPNVSGDTPINYSDSVSIRNALGLILSSEGLTFERISDQRVEIQINPKAALVET